jgi:3-methyladenine DNA glycosylase AlkD
MAAVELLAASAGLLARDDLPLLERLLREARTWALVDPLAIEVVGPLLESHPDARTVLDAWAVDADFWLRRSVLLTHLLPMRRGDAGVFARFADFADDMLEEREFFIRKAIGWVLRERAKKRPAEVLAWLEPRRERASGLTLREASKHLNREDRARLLPRSHLRSPS